MEKLAGDLLFGLKLVKLSILPTLFIQFVLGSLGELKSRYLGFKEFKGLGHLFLALLHKSIMATVLKS